MGTEIYKNARIAKNNIFEIFEH